MDEPVTHRRRGVSIVIPNHRYGRSVGAHGLDLLVGQQTAEHCAGDRFAVLRSRLTDLRAGILLPSSFWRGLLQRLCIAAVALTLIPTRLAVAFVAMHCVPRNRPSRLEASVDPVFGRQHPVLETP
jgi:hypothetical protein